MSVDIVYGAIKNPVASKDLVDTIQKMSKDYNGSLFLGYPLKATADNKVSIDALFVTKEKGLIAFIFDDDNFRDHQDQLFYQITNTLNAYESLRERRRLAVQPTIISYYAQGHSHTSQEDYICACSNNLADELEKITPFKSEYFKKLEEALQKISSLKPKKRRQNVKTDSSKGAIIKEIERQIANLDLWQKKAAYEIPEGPQRIRGLAGSGKTVVLALKAAYLHSQYPEWNIAVTFYTRALYQQFKEMISKFLKEFTNDEPDWNKLTVLHAWGTYIEDGIYSIAAKNGGFILSSYDNARSKYGREHAFEGICREAVSALSDKKLDIYDAILIDEAQDMPCAFFKLCYLLAKSPKRIVFAYDELQNLGGTALPTLSEMFGKDKSGNDLVVLKNNEGSARQDIVMPLCYRNTPWALSLAHSLGFGIYREKGGIFQLFSEPSLWEEIGYGVISGELESGKQVKLKRREDATPGYFKELIDKEDAVIIRDFSTKESQYEWIANEIKKNINEDELEADDILVVLPDAYYSKSDYADFRRSLIKRGIDSILVGVGTNQDIFRVQGKITCSHIYRAKGNEAPMVYILNSEYCSNNTELRKVRNILFTAITRSRAWVRICGVGESMRLLEKEAKKCIDNDYALEFRIPTDDELKEINLIHRDRSERELRDAKKAAELSRQLLDLIQNKGIKPTEISEMSELSEVLTDFSERIDFDES